MRGDLTIFYTDDDLEDLDFFTEIVDIIDENVVVITYNSGQKLLDALNNPPPTPHLVFLDINMPGLNGFETLKKMKQLGRYNDVPVIIFSTSNDDSAVEKSRQLGANFYLPKSGIFDELKKSIEHALSINWNNFIAGKHNFVYTY